MYDKIIITDFPVFDVYIYPLSDLTGYEFNLIFNENL